MPKAKKSDEKELIQGIIAAFSEPRENKKGLILNNILSLVQARTGASEGRLRQLRAYTLAMMEPLLEHQKGNMISEYELVTVLLAGALLVQSGIVCGKLEKL